SAIVSVKVKQGNLETAIFLKVAKSFVCRVKKELNGNNGGELAVMRKRKENFQRSADSLRTPEFVRRVRGMMDDNCG
ncbi:unnamed protein product, partial [Hymenolepis diminuta]